MTWGWLAILGGFVGVDATGLGQFMVSRPLVAASLTGLLLGRPVEGAVLGAVLELFSLVVLPVGAARYPEGGTGAVATTAAYAMAAPPGLQPGPLLMAVAFGLAWEQVGGFSVHRLRLVNERLVGNPAASGRLTPAGLERRHLMAILLDFLRGSAVTVSGAAVGTVFLRVLGPYWGLGDLVSFTAVGVAVAAMAGATVSLFGGWQERRVPFLLGFTCGLLLLLA